MSKEDVEEILREFEADLRSPHETVGLLLNSELAFPKKSETAGSMKERIIPHIMEALRQKLTPLVAEKEDCATCTPELYAHKKNGQTVPICKKHYDELLTPQTQPASTGWDKWVRTLANSTNPHDVDLLVAKIDVFLSEVREDAFEAGKLQGREEALREAIEAVKGISCGDPFLDTDDVIEGYLACKAEALAALTSLAAPTEITHNKE